MLSGVGGGVKGRDKPQLLFVKTEKGAAVNDSESTSGQAPWACTALTWYGVFSTKGSS